MSVNEGQEFYEKVTKAFEEDDVYRFGAVWIVVDELRRGLEGLNKSQMGVATVKDCVNIILAQFPDDFARLMERKNK